MKDHNPYSPPQTEVREPVAPDDAIPRPRQVTRAVRLLWVELALSVVQAVLEIPEFPLIVSGITAALLLLEALVIHKLSIRRNWARYLTLASSILGLVMWLASLKDELPAHPMLQSVEGIELILDLIALFLLFTRPGKDWFKPRRAG